MSHTYKNVSEVKQYLPGIGEVDPGATVVTISAINNPNFELQQDTNQQKVIGTQAPQPNMVTDVTPVKEGEQK